MPGLKVTPEQLGTLSATTHRVSSQVRSEHQGLKSQLSPLFGADWSGAAAAQFTALYEQFDRSATGMSDALDGIAAVLARAGTTYSETETAIAASFR